jgi:hypothetical protein
MFNVIMNEICNKMREKIKQIDVKAFIYADDIMICSEDVNELETRLSCWERVSKGLIISTLAEKKIGHLVYANGWSGSTVVTITLLFTFIMILLTVHLPTHLEQTKSVCAIIYLYIKKCIMLEMVRTANKIITFEVSMRFIT